MSDRSVDVLVVGAGVAGLSVALGLAAARRVLVVDIARSYAARCAAGSRPPTRKALVAVASALSRLVWIFCTRTSWAASSSARPSE